MIKVTQERLLATDSWTGPASFFHHGRNTNILTAMDRTCKTHNKKQAVKLSQFRFDVKNGEALLPTASKQQQQSH